MGTYQYLSIDGEDDNAIKHFVHNDKRLNSVNSDFDTYSKEADLDFEQKFDKPKSEDDVLRANDGSYFGLASKY